MDYSMENSMRWLGPVFVLGAVSLISLCAWAFVDAVFGEVRTCRPFVLHHTRLQQVSREQGFLQPCGRGVCVAPRSAAFATHAHPLPQTAQPHLQAYRDRTTSPQRWVHALLAAWVVPNLVFNYVMAILTPPGTTATLTREVRSACEPV